MVGFVVILAAAPDIYSNTLKVPPIGSRLTGTAFVLSGSPRFCCCSPLERFADGAGSFG